MMLQNDPAPLTHFLRWLMTTSPEQAPSQSEVARRSGVSQSEVCKILGHSNTKPRLATIQKLTAAYWTEWCEYLAAHEDIREALARAYRWALCEPRLTVREISRRMEVSRQER